MAKHHLNATCETVHVGGFSPHLPPALTVESGDAIAVETYTGFYLCDNAPEAFVPPELAEIRKNLPQNRIVSSGSHLLTGPVAVRGAKPGDVLEVRLNAIEPSLRVGFNAVRRTWGVLPERFSQSRVDFVELDLERRTAEFPRDSNIQIPLTPFFGILGVATDTVRSSIPPGEYGGNIDDKLLQAGSRLFLPVFVPEAMFSIGDGHGAQGDGEVNVTAIETSMRGEIELHLHRNLSLTAPLAETPEEWVVMGFGETLDKALEDAVTQAIAILERFLGLSPDDAYVLCSLAVDFQIVQAVNRPRKGVRGRLPKSIFAIALP
ncbi:Acetamidase [Geitlerinema sp. FC II]|nr:acetamidase/formamidase family protein [Geitlerinema sp. CS-897]PPT11201.1 Acetamidase [Geitlerinema sp. FC II]